MIKNPDSNHVEESSAEFRSMNQIPSNFVPYDFNSLKVRPYRVGEVEALNGLQNPKISEIVRVIKDITDKDILELAYIDLKAVMVYSLMLSNDECKWTAKLTCPTCGTHFNKSIVLPDLNFQEVSKDVKFPIRIDTELFKDDKFDILRVKHLIELESILNKMELNEKLLTIALVSDKDTMEMYNKLFTAPSSDKLIKSFDALYNLVDKDIDPVKVMCPNNKLYITFETEDDRAKLRTEFPELRSGVEKLYLPIENEDLLKVMAFIESNYEKDTYKYHGCQTTITKEVELDLSLMFPDYESQDFDEGLLKFG